MFVTWEWLVAKGEGGGRCMEETRVCWQACSQIMQARLKPETTKIAQGGCVWLCVKANFLPDLKHSSTAPSVPPASPPPGTHTYPCPPPHYRSPDNGLSCCQHRLVGELCGAELSSSITHGIRGRQQAAARRTRPAKGGGGGGGEGGRQQGWQQWWVCAG